MAEMNGSMNHSQCAPPTALCLQFPSVQACTEGLPLVLQRPDNFPRVMGILHEMNQEKVGFARSAENTQRPSFVNEVKQESADTEEHHQSLNSDLYQEWSLKGVEELLTEPEELQLRQDCFQQAHEPATANLEACVLEEKPLMGLQPVHSPNAWKDVEQEGQLDVDRKPLFEQQVTSSVHEQYTAHENASHIDEKSKMKEIFHAERAQTDGNSRLHPPVSISFQVHMEDRQALHCIHAVKREPEEVEAQALTWDKQQAKSLEEGKVSTDSVDAIGTETFVKISHCKSGHRPQLERVQSCKSEFKPQMKKRSLSLSSVQRNANPVLVALPAEFSELEKSHLGKGYAELSSSTSAGEGTVYPSVTSNKGQQALVQDGRPQSVASVAEADGCVLTLSLSSSKPQVGSPDHLSLDCNEDKPVVVEPLIKQGKHDGQHQRASPHRWQQSGARGVSGESCRGMGQCTMPACTKKQVFPAADGCLIFSSKDVENPSGQVGCMSNDVNHHDFPVDAKESKNIVLQSNTSQLLSATSNSRPVTSSRVDAKGSRRTLQLMPQGSDERAPHPEEGEMHESVFDDGQITKPDLPAAMESSQPSQAKVAPQLTKPPKKRMRGNLPLNEKEDATPKEKDTRCHRSDGKSWRCVRECINGAYYCQYHLRKRRIGYNRRKNREVNPDDLEAVSKESSKSKKKTW